MRDYWDKLEKAAFTTDITSNLGQSTLEYKLDYVYNKNDSDTFTITAPEVLSGITASIAGEGAGILTLQYDGTALDAPGPSRAGLTPADAVPYLLRDLRTASPTESWTESADGAKYNVLKYEHEDESDGSRVTRQIWLSGNTPVRAEIYADGECVLTLLFSAWT